MVEPYSGDILDMVALSGRLRELRPGPKNSTNWLTTPFLLSNCVIVRTRSVPVEPIGSSPTSFTPNTRGTCM